MSKVRKTPQISDSVTRKESATRSIASIKVSSFEYCWMMLSSMFTRTLIRMKQVTKLVNECFSLVFKENKRIVKTFETLYCPLEACLTFTFG